MTVNVVARGTSKQVAAGRRWEDDDEIWVINHSVADPVVPHYDRAFYFDKAFEQHPAFQKVDKVKAITYHNFPLTEIMDSVVGARPYFTSSIAYVLAYAAYVAPDRLRLYGVDLMGTEYRTQLPCCMFWLGILAGQGTTIEVAHGSNLFADQARMYGDITWKAQPFTYL
jgi:hypothetical protein